MTDATEHRPGDIAMVTNDEHPDGAPGVCMPSPGSLHQQWLDTFGRMLRRPLTVGPVLGNVGDIAVGGSRCVNECAACDEDTP